MTVRLEDVARQLGLSDEAVRRACVRGQIPHYRVGRSTL